MVTLTPAAMEDLSICIDIIREGREFQQAQGERIHVARAVGLIVQNPGVCHAGERAAEISPDAAREGAVCLRICVHGRVAALDEGEQDLCAAEFDIAALVRLLRAALLQTEGVDGALGLLERAGEFLIGIDQTGHDRARVVGKLEV